MGVIEKLMKHKCKGFNSSQKRLFSILFDPTIVSKKNASKSAWYMSQFPYSAFYFRTFKKQQGWFWLRLFLHYTELVLNRHANHDTGLSASAPIHKNIDFWFQWILQGSKAAPRRSLNLRVAYWMDVVLNGIAFPMETISYPLDCEHSFIWQRGESDLDSHHSRPQSHSA